MASDPWAVLEQARASLRCLYVQVPHEVADDVSAAVEPALALVNHVAALREALIAQSNAVEELLATQAVPVVVWAGLQDVLDHARAVLRALDDALTTNGPTPQGARPSYPSVASRR